MKYFAWSILLLGTFVLSHLYYHQVICGIRFVITLPYLNLYAGGVSIIFTVLSKIKLGKISFHGKMSFEDFRASLSDVISFIDNPIIIVGSLGLAKGLFLYYFDSVPFFPFLKNYEITLVLIVTLYLLYTSTVELWSNILKTLFSDIIPREKPQATPREQIQNREVPEPE
jgi:hypothetical protein